MDKTHSSWERLIKVLREKKLVSEDGINSAIQEQKKKGGKLTDILVSLGLVSKKDLTIVLCTEFGYPAIDLSKYKLIPDIVKIVPKKIAKFYKVIPVSQMGKVLTVAMADPLDVLAIDDLKSITGCEIGPVISNETDIINAIAEHYDGVTHESIEQMVGGIQEEGPEINLVAENKEGDVSGADLIRMTQEAPVVKITNMLLAEAVKLRSSDILIEPMETDVRVRYRIDGILVEGRRPPKKIHSAIISRLKVMSDLDIAEKRLPQDGRFKIKLQNREVDFRISILPSNKGEKAALRVLDKSQATLDLDKLGFDEKPLKDMRDAAEHPHGMILVCGPTGCGKTTTLYSILKFIDTPEDNVVTVEDPVEYQLAGINQVSVRSDIGLTFAASLRSILRQDPDIIMIGEIRDFDTVDIAIKAALTGHLVLSTLHTTSACGSIVRLVNMGVEPFLITSSVLLVASQRLVRKICPQCKEPYTLDEKIAKQLGLKGAVTVYKGKGCKVCQNTGYKGRIGLIETLVLSPKIRDLIIERAEEHVIADTAIKEGMITLRKCGIGKVLDGSTTVEEVLRVTAGEQDIETKE